MAAAAWGGLLVTPLAAFERPLSPRAVREAYFMGQRNDEKTTSFLARYRKPLPLPKRGPHVAEIEIRTPYAQVVNRSRHTTVGYSTQQAQKNYKARPDSILVRVWINLTPSFALSRHDFWRDFRIRLVQQREIASKAISGSAIYSGGEYGSTLMGAEVMVEFDAVEVASVPARIEVLTPDGQVVVAEFDLGSLR